MSRECTSITHIGPEMRLDRMLRDNLGCGLRRSRGLIARGRVLAEGKVVRGKAFIVRPGQKLTVLHGPTREEKPDGVFVVREDGMWAALYKPAGVHSEMGQSSRNAALLLPDLFPDRNPVLLNRLDFATSGLLLVGLCPEAGKKYTHFQEQGLVDKTYAAVVCGSLKSQCTVAAYIDQSRRRRVRVEKKDDPNPLRHTEVLPLRAAGADLTLVRVRIKKGRRHQIRAHLAAIGHPIFGDGVYGAPGEGGRLYLHHESLVFPEFAAECPPDWQGEFLP
jgi:23S rRNA pseudouridine1911/1915/1917 synthase